MAQKPATKKRETGKRFDPGTKALAAFKSDPESRAALEGVQSQAASLAGEILKAAGQNPSMLNIIPHIPTDHQPGTINQDVISYLMKNRILIMEGGVSSESSIVLCAAMLAMNLEDPNKPIRLFINSPGGDVTGMFAIMDTMDQLNCPVETIVTGQAASAATFIAAHGTYGMRTAYPNSQFMYHQPSGGMQGKATDMVIQVKVIEEMKERATHILAQRTGANHEFLDKLMDRDSYVSAEFALQEIGSIDAILPPLKHAPYAGIERVRDREQSLIGVTLVDSARPPHVEMLLEVRKRILERNAERNVKAAFPFPDDPEYTTFHALVKIGEEYAKDRFASKAENNLPSAYPSSDEMDEISKAMEMLKAKFAAAAVASPVANDDSPKPGAAVAAKRPGAKR